MLYEIRGEDVYPHLHCEDNIRNAMSAVTAVIDATRHDSVVPETSEVAGLGLLERTIRLADVVGCDHAVVVAHPDRRQQVDEICDSLAEDERFPIECQVQTPQRTSRSAVVEASSSALADSDHGRDTILFLDSRTVYPKRIVDGCLERLADDGGICTLDAEVSTQRTGEPTLFAADWHAWSRLGGLVSDADQAGLTPLFAKLSRSIAISTVDFDLDDDWISFVSDAADAESVDRRIWQDCHKDSDGPVSRHFNRHVSTSVSQFLAPLGTTPNQMSAVTFAVGLAATFTVAVGGFWWFLLGAALYQLSSILDGVDGELARSKFEFSVTGEWVDNISDNTKDILFLLGLGYGAYQTVPVEWAGFDSTLWLWMGALGATGKLLSFLGYASWLIPRGRGYALLLWADEDEDDPDNFFEGIFSAIDVLCKNDVVLFLAFALAVVGALPWYLMIAAIGHNIAALTIVNKLLSSETKLRPEPELSPEKAREAESKKAA